MNSFTISELQRYSGISVHSIRAWEKRYGALKPDRSDGNTRYYNGIQLRRLLNIAALMNSDYKISELCNFSDSKLFDLIGEKLENADELVQDELLVSQIVSSALQFNEALFDKIFSRAVIRYGMERSYLQVIYPAMKRIGLMWSADRVAPAQEHFMTHLLQQKLNSAIDLLPVNHASPHHWLLFLPENEFHETGLLMAYYLIRLAGHRCTYLGGNVPVETLKDALPILKPTDLLFFLICQDDKDQDALLLKKIQKNLKKEKLFVAAHEDRLKEQRHGKFKVLSSMNELKDLLQTMSK